MVKWSPWVEKDTAMKTEIAGTDGTVGAMWKWEGNKEVGKGEQTFTKIEEPNGVASDIHFIKPMDGHATSSVNLTDTEGGVKVIWRTDFEMPRPWNVFGLFMNMEKEMNTTFDRGLAKLKDLTEKQAAMGGTMTINEITTEPKTYIGIKKNVPMDKISDFFAESMPGLFGKAGNANLKLVGPPSGLYFTWDEKTMTTDVAAVAPVAEAKGDIGSLQKFTVGGGKALEMDFLGDYKNLGMAHNKLKEYAASKNMKTRTPVLEEYITDPMSEKDPNKWLTKVYYFIE